MKPHPWQADWQQATSLVQKSRALNVKNVIWVASGVSSNDTGNFYDALKTIAPTKIYSTATPIYTLTPPANDGEAPAVVVMRANTDGDADITVNALARDGHMVAHWPARFTEGSPRTTVALNLPAETRNGIARFEIDAPRTAASTALLDAAWEHRAVGLVGDASELDRHSLLSEIYYIDRALKPYADIKVDTLDVLIKAKMPMIVITDSVDIGADTISVLNDWLKKGGVLVRFAGERFAGAADHHAEANILPVSLREGGRSLGGSLTWGAPQKLHAFPSTSPFYKLTVPDDVAVNRQILAEPAPDLAAKTWAALADGTPLVTASSKGQGISILFHVPANNGWSNLPISGLFVEMLRAISHMSRGDQSQISKNSSLPPLSILDAVGEAQTPPTTVTPIPDISAPISPQHPPGLYGGEGNFVALNLGAAIGQPQSLTNVPSEIYTVNKQNIDLQPYLLAAAFLLLLGDFLLSLHMRGFLKFALLLLCLFANNPAQATDDKTAVELTSKTYLAYVRTGDSSVDHVSQLGLRSLAILIQSRTSIDTMGVAEVDPDADDLAFFPLLYWPVVAVQKPLSAEGARRVSHYLHHGGMILFDAVNGDTSAPIFLQRVLAGVELPPLIRIPEKHVLKRTFYLLNELPGRFVSHDIWLEPEEASAYDGVASVIYGSNNWAAAWAMEGDHPLFPCTPDGEAQRERAFRFGVNLVMYALTGNYKNDQLQTDALLKRMSK